MFYLIGVGLKPGHLTPEAKEAVSSCGKVFLENYTSCYSQGSVQDLKSLLGRDIAELDRKGVEEGFEQILKESKSSGESIALLVFGNALSATTHVQLLLDAKELGLKCRVVPGISIYDYLGSVGLDQYRFGRTCTVVAPKENYSPESFYDVVEANYSAGLHTLCLLDIDKENDRMMPVSEALDILFKIEKKRGKSILGEATLVGLYGLGSDRQAVKSGSLNVLKRSNFGLFPQSLIVASELTGKEKEALEGLNG